MVVVVCCQGSHAPGKSWIFLGTISKSWKMGLVLESPGNLSARSWNFLGYDNDVGGGQNDAGADAEICIFAHFYRLFH